MSLMCPLQGCGEKPGMCRHVKMMFVVLLMLIVGLGAYVLFMEFGKESFGSSSQNDHLLEAVLEPQFEPELILQTMVGKGRVNASRKEHAEVRKQSGV